MIKITFKPDEFELKITGHAECGDKGEDIVCAAVSTLFYTLGQTLYESKEMLENELVFKDEDGKGYLKCIPKKGFEGNIARSYYTILQGFILVAGNYPQNVKIFVK